MNSSTVFIKIMYYSGNDENRKVSDSISSNPSVMHFAFMRFSRKFLFNIIRILNF